MVRVFLPNFSTLITDAVAELKVYRENVEAKLSPYATKETSEQLKQELDLLTSKLQNDMHDAKERATQYLQELKTLMVQNSDDVRNRIQSYTRKLKKRLGKDIDEIRKWVWIRSLK